MFKAMKVTYKCDMSNHVSIILSVVNTDVTQLMPLTA